MIFRMLSHELHYYPQHRQSLGRMALWVLWQVLRLPTLAVLLVLEPLVSLVLTSFGLLGIVVALIIKFSGDLPHFPFWLMMTFSTGAVLMLMGYHVLIVVLSKL